MSDRTDFQAILRNARTSGAGLCSGFQRDLSCLLDQEIAEQPARRALAHLESCGTCAEFFQAIRLQALAHKDLSLPGSLARRLQRLRGHDFFEGLSDSEIVRRLAGALYLLGKAHVLLATDDEYLLEIAEEPVEIDRFQSGEMNEAADLARSSGACPVPETVLHGGTADHLEQGLRLLEEALKMKPRFAEARLYLGFVRQLKNEPEAAAEAYREVFLRTDRTVNRAHAAIQLGLLYDRLGESRKALRIFRWVLACGLLRRKPEFAFVLHNIAVAHIALGNLDDALRMFLRMKTEFPETWEHSKKWLLGAPETLARLHHDPAARRFLEESEPVLLAACQG